MWLVHEQEAPQKHWSCQGLAMRLREISQYLSQVVAGKLPMNQATCWGLSTRDCELSSLPAGNHIPTAGDFQSDAGSGAHRC